MSNKKIQVVMFFDLHGKTALITGASSGLGEGMAFVLPQRGVKVILAARREGALHAICNFYHYLAGKFDL